MKIDKSQKQHWAIKASYRMAGTVQCVPLCKDWKCAKRYAHIKYTYEGSRSPTQGTDLVWKTQNSEE